MSNYLKFENKTDIKQIKIKYNFINKFIEFILLIFIKVKKKQKKQKKSKK